MGQTTALLVDAYRELNAKKLFWITLILSGVLVVVFAGLDLRNGSMFAFGLRIDLPIDFDRELFFKIVFTQFGIGVWLTWAATILALISTAGIIPDLLSSGTVEMLVSKPIGRVRLLLTKYAFGLLFVALQVAVFAVGTFLVFGIKGVMWEPRILLAIPIVLAFYSYLFCVCVLLGLLTRSTVASLLLTLLLWLVLFILTATHASLVSFREMGEVRAERLETRIERMETGTRRQLASEQGNETAQAATAEELDMHNPVLASTRRDYQEASEQAESLDAWVGRLDAVKTVLPKTSETIGLLERVLFSEADLRRLAEQGAGGGPVDVDVETEDDDFAVSQEGATRAQEELRDRSLWWVLGTSLVFEAVVLGLCCWIFGRRDF